MPVSGKNMGRFIRQVSDGDSDQFISDKFYWVLNMNSLIPLYTNYKYEDKYLIF
ncbi:MAG: hypothetical protein RLZZ507_4366 [Cyanobacteriota bacterium]|jgi:hypothetical protein